MDLVVNLYMTQPWTMWRFFYGMDAEWVRCRFFSLSGMSKPFALLTDFFYRPGHGLDAWTSGFLSGFLCGRKCSL